MATTRVRRAWILAIVFAGLVAVPASPGGADGNEAPGAPLLARSVTSGSGFSCARLPDGSVKCWGKGGAHLGQGDTVARVSPDRMGANLVPVNLGTGRTATALSAGADHVCAILDNATLKCWGVNHSGRLGIGGTSARGNGPGQMGDALPAVNLGTGATAAAVAVGDDHTCALLGDGGVKCWGSNNSGQLGQGHRFYRGEFASHLGDNLAPLPLGTGRTATALAAGEEHTCALLDNGSVKCWGDNEFGQLGIGSTANRGDEPYELGDSLPAVDLGTGRTATAITAGADHSCALLDNGTVKCWGRNESGQLGLGDIAPRGDSPGETGDAQPPVDLGAGRTATAVAASGTTGSHHTCAVLDNGAAKCWGENASGQLGLGDTADRGNNFGEMGDNLAAIDLGTGRTALTVTTGSATTCAVRDDGYLRCWGQSIGDGPGEMGDNLPNVELTGTGIAGRVTDVNTGGPLTNVFVAVLSATDFSLVRTVFTNGDANFGVELPPGNYHLFLFTTRSAYQAAFHGSPTSIPVSAGLTTVNPTMGPRRGSITGTIHEDGTANTVGLAWALALSSTGAPETGVVANTSGQFTIDNLEPGAHYVAYLDPSGFHDTRFHPAAQTLPASDPVNVVAGVATTADGTLPPHVPDAPSSTITGQVTGAISGTALPNVWVVALRRSDFRLTRGAITAADGTYTLAVPPGDHVVGFIDPAGRHALEWWDDQPASGLGSAATVTAPAVDIDPALAPLTGTISGRVRRGATGWAGVWVLAIGPTGIVGSTITAGGGGANGNYQLSGLPPGNYRLLFIDPPARSIEFHLDQPTFAAATPVAVAAGSVVVVDPDINT